MQKAVVQLCDDLDDWEPTQTVSLSYYTTQHNAESGLGFHIVTSASPPQTNNN